MFPIIVAAEVDPWAFLTWAAVADQMEGLLYLVRTPLAWAIGIGVGFMIADFVLDRLGEWAAARSAARAAGGGGGRAGGGGGGKEPKPPKPQQGGGSEGGGPSELSTGGGKTR